MDRTFEEMLVRQCAPTLAVLKPGSLFCITAEDLENVRKKVRFWDQRLEVLGLSVRILLERREAGSALVYVYRGSQLEQSLGATDRRGFLVGMGYRGSGTEQMLDQLVERLSAQSDFPHEIGVFLGYPLRDVVGFIENRGQNFTCCGFWKSYSDPNTIQRCFACYRQCVNIYVRMYERGIPIEKMVIAA